MKFRPLHDRVVIERIDAEAKTAGGIIIPDTAQEKPQQGKVIAVGPGGRDESGKLIPIDVKVGDRILFGKWSGSEVKIDGNEYLIMKESDIMGVLVEAEAKDDADRAKIARVIYNRLEAGMPLGIDATFYYELGPDRIVNAVAARERYGAPCIVVDFGTWTNFDAV